MLGARLREEVSAEEGPRRRLVARAGGEIPPYEARMSEPSFGLAGTSRPLAELADGALAARVACADGSDREAEAEVCRRFAGRIRLYGLRHLRSEAAAADLVQQVLLLVLQRLRAGQVREAQHLGAYVLGACRLVVREGRRAEERRGAQLWRFAAELEEAAPAESASLELGQLDDCLQALGERERAVVLLTFYAERPTAEIASDVGASEGDVRVIRHRALARLRGCLGLSEVA